MAVGCLSCSGFFPIRLAPAKAGLSWFCPRAAGPWPGLSRPGPGRPRPGRFGAGDEGRPRAAIAASFCPSAGARLSPRPGIAGRTRPVVIGSGFGTPVRTLRGGWTGCSGSGCSRERPSRLGEPGFVRPGFVRPGFVESGLVESGWPGTAGPATLRRRPAAPLARACLFRPIGSRRTAFSTSWRRSCPSAIPGSSLALWRARPERWGGLASGTSIGPLPATLRGAERGIAAAAGARRPRCGAGLPPREGPGCGSFSFCSTPPAGSIWPGSARCLRSFCGASIRRCGARSDIGPVGAAPGHESWPRTRRGTRLASAAHTLIFLPPARSAGGWPGCRLPRRPARGARSGWCLPSCSGCGRGGWGLGGCGLRCRHRCGSGPAEDGSGCGSGSGWRYSRQIRASRCLDLSRPGSLHRLGRSPRLRSSRRFSRLGELGQAVFQKVVGLRVHGEGMDLARGG